MIQICITGNGPATFLWLVSHMTGLKLRSDWDVQILSRDVNWTKLFAPKSPDPFPSSRVGSGDETTHLPPSGIIDEGRGEGNY